MKNLIKVNIIPLYTNTSKYNIYEYNKNNNSHLDIVKVDKLLNDLANNFDISQVDIIGGEISIMSDFYFEMLFNLLKIYTKKINVFTNFKEIKKGILNNCNNINVVYNFNEFSEDSVQVFKNIKSCDKIINLKSLDISCNKNQDQIIKILNNLKVKSFEIIPDHFHKTIDYNFFESIIKIFLNKQKDMKFAFQNKLQLDHILPIDNYNVQKVFIIPEGYYALQNQDDITKLTVIDNILELKEKLDELEIFSNNLCKNCTSKLMCMSNYFLNLKYNDITCCGFKKLINDYKQGNIVQ